MMLNEWFTLRSHLTEWLLPSVLFGVWIGIVFGLVPIIMKVFKKIARKTRSELDDILISSLHFPLVLILISLGLKIWMDSVPLPEKGVKYIQIIAIILLVFGIILFLDKMFGNWVRLYSKRIEFVKTSGNILQTLFRMIVVAVGILILLDTLGISITPLLASLGIGGLAVAFALQNVLTDIFASFSIQLDRPFKIGDFIITGDDMGVVKNIGIKSTRIQTLQGEELVMSNKELTETRIHNYKKMEKRRIAFNFRVTYDTPVEKLKKILTLVKDIIDKVELVDLDRVHFRKFGDFSLDFEVVYYLNSSDYNKYMDTQQEINLAIKEKFEKESIKFAYPTQTIFINK